MVWLPRAMLESCVASRQAVRMTFIGAGGITVTTCRPPLLSYIPGPAQGETQNPVTGPSKPGTGGTEISFDGKAKTETL